MCTLSHEDCLNGCARAHASGNRAWCCGAVEPAPSCGGEAGRLPMSAVRICCQEPVVGAVLRLRSGGMGMWIAFAAYRKWTYLEGLLVQSLDKGSGSCTSPSPPFAIRLRATTLRVPVSLAIGLPLPEHMRRGQTLTCRPRVQFPALNRIADSQSLASNLAKNMAKQVHHFGACSTQAACSYLKHHKLRKETSQLMHA
jgi:hypothetical protein